MAHITQLDRRVVQLGWVRVELPAHAEGAGLQLGQEIAVRGRWDGEGIVAESYAVDPRVKFANRPRRLALEGYVLECDAPGRYAVNGMPLNETAEVRDASAYVGRRVIVQGELSGGALNLQSLRALSADLPAESDANRPAGSREPSSSAFEEHVRVRIHCGG
jgi:hypothetical protein